MSARGELVTFDSPLDAVARALAGAYTALADGGQAGTGTGTAAGAGIAVRDELDKLVCRIEVKAVPGGSSWLTLAPLRGYGEDAERIRERLLAAGFSSERGWKSAQVPMAADERADVAVTHVLLRLLEIMDANLPAVLADAGPDFLHDYRVALRRTRSVQRQMREVFDPEALARVCASFRWLQEQTGATRDLEVYLDDFRPLLELAPAGARADLAALEPLLRERHARARAAMREALTSRRAHTLRADWWELLESLALAERSGFAHAGTTAPAPPAAALPVAALAAKRIRKAHRKMVEMGGAITPGSPPGDYHRLRRQGKELRYLLELFGTPLFDPEIVRQLVVALKGLQDVLGRHQDREVQIELLRELGHELAARPGGPRELIAIGTLIDRLDADAAAAREQFAESFAQFASKAQCRLVTRAFGRGSR